MEKLLYSISETAELLGESTSAVRYWANYFEKFVRPQRNAKGNRLFTAADIEVLKQIKHLLKDSGLTLEGTARKLATERHFVEKKMRALDSLKKIRSDLEAVRKSL